jgi:site-specific DNA-methyltransferase (adenine-specific)
MNHLSDAGKKVAAVLAGESTGCIINGDCLSVMAAMPDNAVDAVVTSPPYNTLPQSSTASGMHKGNQWVEKAANGYSDSMPEFDYQEWLRSVITESIRITGGLVWVNHKVRYRDGAAIHPAQMLPFPIYSEVIWDRGGSMALNCKRYAPSHEVILGFGRPIVWNNDGNKAMSVWRIAPQRSTSHPCPFPLEIPSRLISSCSGFSGIILDPFCGSGTTCVAAKKLGRRYIGIEIDPAYCEIARARVAATTPPLFTLQSAKGVV